MSRDFRRVWATRLSFPQCLCHRRHQHKVSIFSHTPSQSLSHCQYFRTKTVAPVYRAPTMAQGPSLALGTEKGSQQWTGRQTRGGAVRGRQANPRSQVVIGAGKCAPGPVPREEPRVRSQNRRQAGALPTDWVQELASPLTFGIPGK